MTPERFERIKRVLCRRQTDLAVVMENVGNPHNIGAIARTCDAVGIPDVHAITRLDEVVLGHRAQSGCGKWVTAHAHGSVDEAYACMRKKGMRILTAHFSEDAVDFREIDYTRPTAIIVGEELDGITPEAAEKADGSIVVPMMGMVQSLNVSVATALILFEAQRQRKAAGMYDSRNIDEETYTRLLFEWGYPRVATVYQKDNRAYPGLDENGYPLGEW